MYQHMDLPEIRYLWAHASHPRCTVLLASFYVHLVPTHLIYKTATHFKIRPNSSSFAFSIVNFPRCVKEVTVFNVVVFIGPKSCIQVNKFKIQKC